MNWLTPLTGLYLALAVIPPLVLLYFLKLRRKPQPIACTLLWQRSVEDLRANVPFQRLRKSLLLFLQLLALGLLVAAVMQPQMQGGRLEGGRTVILIDNSASMTARDVEEVESRLEEAKRLAREQVERRYGGGVLGGSAGETMIVAFSDRAEIYSQFTDSKQRLLAAIDRIRPTHGSTRIDEALKLARAHTTNVVDSMGEARPTGDPATIELYTDGRIDDLADHALRGEVLHYHPIGSPTPDNIAIASISVERPFDEPTKVQVFVAVLNFNASEVTCRLELSVNGNVPLGGVKDVTVPASTIDESTGSLIPGRNNLVFTPFEQPRDAIIVVRNLREDDLEADDVAQLVVPPARRLRVALVDGGGFVLRTALEGLPLESLTLLDGATFDEIAAAGPFDAYDVVVLGGHLTEALPAGRYLIFGEPPPIGGLNPYGEPGGRQIVLDSRDDHPAMRFVGMDDVFISRHQRIQPDDEVTVLAQGSETAVVVEYARPPMKVIYVAFDPLDSNWPLLRSFVTFVYNSIEYLGTSGEAVASEGLEPGDAVSTRLPESATEIELRGPDGALRPVNVGDPSLFSWGPTRLTGIYTLSWAMPDVEPRLDRSFAVNLASEREGEIAALEAITIGREDVERVGAEGSRYIPLWPWAIGVCLVVLLFEWYVYNRKMYW